MPAYPVIPPAELESLCRVVGDSGEGLSGSEIGLLLAQMGFSDPGSGITKWRRLLKAFSDRQNEDFCSNRVLEFIGEVMKPVRYVNHDAQFEHRRLRVNQVLCFVGVEICQRGQLRRCDSARTISEAQSRAGRLRSELLKRGVHAEVLRFCKAELLADNCFHAVLEVTKSLSEKIRQKTLLAGDGAELADKALSLGKTGMPLLAFNSLQTASERSEQTGLLNLLKGVFGTFRNTTAHAPRIFWNMSEQDAIDLLSMASFLHRRLDAAVRTPRPLEE